LFDPNNTLRSDIGNEADAKPSLSLTETAKTTLANNNDSSKSVTTTSAENVDDNERRSREKRNLGHLKKWKRRRLQRAQHEGEKEPLIVPTSEEEIAPYTPFLFSSLSPTNSQ
jgi:hypothetical protein